VSAPRNAHTAEIGSRRSYTFRGKDYPSVTTILKLGRPMEWMGMWSAKVVAELAMAGIIEHGGFEAVVEWDAAFRAEHAATKTHQERHKNRCPHDALTPEVRATRHLKAAPWRRRDIGREHGSSVHDVLEALAAGETLPEDAPGREQLEAWRGGYRPDILDSEAQVVNTEHGYAGSFDLLARIYGRVTLIDLKTSKLFDGDGKRKNVGRDWSLQLAAYRHATHIFSDDESWTMPPIDDCAVLWVPSDAPEQWMFLSVPANGDEFAAFLAAKATHDDHRKYEKSGTPATIILPQVVTVDEVTLKPVLTLVQGGAR
jgi:hypothetical protein